MQPRGKIPTLRQSLARNPAGDGRLSDCYPAVLRLAAPSTNQTPVSICWCCCDDRASGAPARLVRLRLGPSLRPVCQPRLDWHISKLGRNGTRHLPPRGFEAIYGSGWPKPRGHGARFS